MGSLCHSVLLLPPTDHRLSALWEVSGLVGLWGSALRDAGWSGRWAGIPVTSLEPIIRPTETWHCQVTMAHQLS